MNRTIPRHQDLIWIVDCRILYEQYPYLSSLFDTMIKQGFGSDEYPGNKVKSENKHEPHFSLEEMVADQEQITFLIYYPQCQSITEDTVLTLSSFCTLHARNGHVTMWNLCSRDRGKGYAGALIDQSTSFTVETYGIPLRLKVYLYNFLFQQVVTSYLKRNFILEGIQRHGTVICMIHSSVLLEDITSIPYHSYSYIIEQCWKQVLILPRSKEKKWLAQRLLVLSTEKGLHPKI